MGTSTATTLTLYDDHLCMAWKGIEGDQGIYFSKFNGSSWAPQQRVSGVGTNGKPALKNVKI